MLVISRSKVFAGCSVGGDVCRGRKAHLGNAAIVIQHHQTGGAPPCLSNTSRRCLYLKFLEKLHCINHLARKEVLLFATNAESHLHLLGLSHPWLPPYDGKWLQQQLIYHEMTWQEGSREALGTVGNGADVEIALLRGQGLKQKLQVIAQGRKFRFRFRQRIEKGYPGEPRVEQAGGGNYLKLKVGQIEILPSALAGVSESGYEWTTWRDQAPGSHTQSSPGQTQCWCNTYVNK